MTGKHKGGKHDLAVVERQRQALALRQRGLTYDAIAQRLGYVNRGGAHKAIARALRATLQEPADELRGLELRRLDALHAALWSEAICGHLPSVDRVLSIMKRRAKLLGLDATQRQEGPVPGTMRELAARMAAAPGLDAATIRADAERILREIAR